MPENQLALREIEETLTLLLDVDPSELTPELRAEYETDLRKAIAASAEKRERVAWRLFDLGQRAAVKKAAAVAHQEKAAALLASAVAFEKDAERLKNYVLDVMREMPAPKKGVRTLEGTSATFKAKGVPPSVEIYDLAALPTEFQCVTISPLPLSFWFQVRDRVIADAEALGVCFETTLVPVPKAEIKAALERRVPCPECAAFPGSTLNEHCGKCNGVGTLAATVPGARLITNKLRLEVS